MKYLLLITLLIASLNVFSQDVKPSPNDSIIRVITTIEVIKKVTPPSNPVNHAPTAFAGSQQTITLPVNSVVLSGIANDVDNNIKSTVWSKVTTLGSTIVSLNNLSTSVTGLVQGTHIFRLTVTDDSNAVATSTVNVIVNGAPPPPDTTGGIKDEGFGSQAIGGSQSSAVFMVKDASSLKAAIGSNRTIKFSQNANIKVRLDLANVSYLTIDGNGFDVTITNGNDGDAVSFNGKNTHHCIIKNLHITDAGGDGVNVIDGANNILISNCTIWGNRDGNLDVTGDNTNVSKNVSVQFCIIAGGAPNSGDYSGSMLITGQLVSVHHNLFIPATVGGIGERAPLVHANYSPPGNPNADIVNNVIFKWGRANGASSGFGIDIAYKATGNAVNNYVYTPNNNAVPGNGITTSAYSEPTGFLYAAGNISGNSGINANSKSNHAVYPIPSFAQVTIQPTCEAVKTILAKVGPLGNGRNATDRGYINSVQTPGCQ